MNVEKISEKELVDKSAKITSWFRGRYGRQLTEQDIEDFRSWVCQKWLEGKRINTSWERIAIDYLRQHTNRAGKRCKHDVYYRPDLVRGEVAQSLLENHKSEIETYRGNSGGDEVQHKGSLGAYLERCRDLRTNVRVMLILRYEFEMTFKEIGYVLGVSESRISQLHDETLRAQKKELQERELPEEQERRKQEESKKVSRALQERSRLSTEEKRILAVLCQRKRVGMDFRTIEKVPETVQGAFEINSF